MDGDRELGQIVVSLCKEDDRGLVCAERKGMCIESGLIPTFVSIARVSMWLLECLVEY